MIEPRDNQSSDQSFSPPPPPWRQNAYNQPVAPIPPMPPMGGNFSGGSLPGVGDLLSQAWRILMHRLGFYLVIASIPIIAQIVFIGILIFSLSGLTSNLKQSFSGALSAPLGVSIGSFLIILGIASLGWIAIMILHLWSQIALIYTASLNENKGIIDAYKYAVRKTFSYLWVIIAASIIGVGGMFLFFIPGLIFMIWFSLAAFVFVNEDVRGMSALLKSKEYVRGRWLSVFWRFFALGLISFGISIAASVILSVIKLIISALLSPSFNQITNIVSLILLLPAQAFITALGFIYGILIYKNLRTLRGSFEFNPSGGQKAGFLAIGIIGALIIPLSLLATISLVALGTAREKGRDIRRLTDIKGIQNALEFYAIDNNGYPAVASPVVLGSDKATRLDVSGWTNSSSVGNPVYMIKVPANSAPGGADYVYSSTDASGAPCTQGPVCVAYTITFKLESGAGGYKSGELIASPPDVIIERNELSNSLKNSQYNANTNVNNSANGDNQNSNSSLFQDTDKDGLSDSIEKSLGTNSNIADTDFDGLSDGDEVNIWKTKPANPDTDGDGFRDGDEVKGGYNPLGGGKTENN